jgi:hypothetical protein
MILGESSYLTPVTETNDAAILRCSVVILVIKHLYGEIRELENLYKIDIYFIWLF